MKHWVDSLKTKNAYAVYNLGLKIPIIYSSNFSVRKAMLYIAEIKSLPCPNITIKDTTIGSLMGYPSISPYSDRMQENANQNNSEYGHFLRSAVNIVIINYLSSF